MYTERGFCKDERLCSKKRIENLFAQGKGFVVYPFRIVYCVVEEESGPFSLLISVPKKRVKRANRRNKVKRHIREAFRLQKQPLYSILNAQNRHLDVAVIYLDTTVKDTSLFSLKIKEALDKLQLVV